MSDEMTVAAFVVLGCLWMVLALVIGLASLSNAGVPAVKGEARCCRALAAAQLLREKIMSVVDAALARFTAFVQGVLAQVKATKDTNDAQTVKLAELQAALDAAVADDAADKSAISTLQAEVNSLQESVAAQINAAVDALENPPVVEPVVEDDAPAEVVEDEVVEVVEAEVVEAEVVEAEADAPVDGEPVQ